VDIQPHPGRRRRHEGAAAGAGRNAIRMATAANFSLLNTTRLLLLLNTTLTAPDTPRGEKTLCFM